MLDRPVKPGEDAGESGRLKIKTGSRRRYHPAEYFIACQASRDTSEKTLTDKKRQRRTI